MTPMPTGGGAGPVRPGLRGVGAGWTAALLVSGAMAMLFGHVSGRADAFGSVAWMAVCASPVLLGGALAATSTADRTQYVARGFAAALLAPIGLALWAGTADGVALPGSTAWLAGLAAVAVQCAVWAVLLLWMARKATRWQPAPGVAPVAWPVLRERLAGLAARGAPLRRVQRGETTIALELEVDPGGERAHCVRLAADTVTRCMQVREQLGVQGARPMPAESSFHRPGDPRVDGARPRVQRVHGRSLQTTALEPHDLAAWPISVWGGQAEGDVVEDAHMRPEDWDGADAAARGRACMALLARVVLDSGWAWQPVLVGRAPRPDAG